MAALGDLGDQRHVRRTEPAGAGHLQSKRLSSIGVLVAGVTHELNNPLNNISMIAQTYLDVYDNLPGDQRREFMRQIEDEPERLRLTIKNLRFIQTQRTAPGPAVDQRSDPKVHRPCISNLLLSHR